MVFKRFRIWISVAAIAALSSSFSAAQKPQCLIELTNTFVQVRDGDGESRTVTLRYFHTMLGEPNILSVSIIIDGRRISAKHLQRFTRHHTSGRFDFEGDPTEGIAQMAYGCPGKKKVTNQLKFTIEYPEDG